jgi:hypothetical protein
VVPEGFAPANETFENRGRRSAEQVPNLTPDTQGQALVARVHQYAARRAATRPISTCCADLKAPVS